MPNSEVEDVGMFAITEVQGATVQSLQYLLQREELHIQQV